MAITLLTATPTVVPWSLISVTLFSIVLSWLWAKRNYFNGKEATKKGELIRFLENNKSFEKDYADVTVFIISEKERIYSVLKSDISECGIKWHRYQWFICIAIFAYHPIVSLFGIQGSWQDVFLGMFVFWTAFDGFLNKLNGNDMLYLGGGWWDGLFKEIPNGRYWMLVVKAICIILSWWAYALPGNIFHLFNSPAV